MPSFCIKLNMTLCISWSRAFISLALSLMLALTSSISPAFSANTMTEMDKASWRFQQSHQQCRLEHRVADDAIAYFLSPVGGSLLLELKWLTKSSQGGAAKLAITGAPWSPEKPQVLEQSRWLRQQIRFSTQANKALTALAKGQWLSLSELSGGRTLILPSIHFQKAYAAFLLCRGDGNNGGRDDVAFSKDQQPLTLHFKAGAQRLSANQIQQLNRLAKHVSSHSQIKRLQIDAFTDNSGNPELNLRLSRSRALEVETQLRRTLSALPMDIHAHGQASPLSDNATPAGRYQNRRVTITLLQVEQAL